MPVRNIVVGQAVTRPKADRSRQLRRVMTPAEKVLWQRLRNNRLNGRHFRRQQVIAGFIVDFYCYAAGVIVNVDGEVHQQIAVADAERDTIFTARGFVSLHVTNEEVLTDLEAALAKIEAVCRCGLPAAPDLSSPHHEVTLPLPLYSARDGPGMRSDTA
jgi:very-short-patch-repair endonuclease